MRSQNNTSLIYAQYPTIADLRKKAKKKVPKFAFEYLDNGCMDNINIQRNIDDLKSVRLQPEYLLVCKNSCMKTTIFGHEYAAPFGFAPVGLQGLMWPNAAEILARAAYENNIPFILSTVSTADIETIADITQGQAWFQLYHPVSDNITADIIARLKSSGYKVLVILADVPTFSYRPCDIKNGLALPPRMTLNNIISILSRPQWVFRTIVHGIPEFKSLKKYMPAGNVKIKQLAGFMNETFDGRLDLERMKKLRELWPGNLVVKGIESISDAEKLARIGIDGLIVSNHGGRQLDSGRSSLESLKAISQAYKTKMSIFMDSGIRSGSDIACSLASGAEFTFLGRAPMYSVCALGNQGGDHIINMLRIQLLQVMQQLGCARVEDLPGYLA